MKRSPGFLEGVALAAAFSLLGAALFATARWMLGTPDALRLLISLLSLAYVSYLLVRAPGHTGRISVIAVSGVVTCVLWLLQLPMSLHLAIYVGMAWLIRSLYFHSAPFAALADLGLHILGLCGAWWAASETQSVALSLWCFFLPQALFTALPQSASRLAKASPREIAGADRFERAHRAAEDALRGLASSN